MTLKHTNRFFLVLSMIFFVGIVTSAVTFAQLPFGDLTPTEDNGELEDGTVGPRPGGPPQGASRPGAPFPQEGPIRPIDRPPVRRPAVRPDDDDLGNDDEPEQSIKVKERFAGWRGVGGVEGKRLSESLRANWVMLDRNGQFYGTVRGIDNADVVGMTVFLMNNGRLVNTAAVQEDGTFVFTNVQRGAYSLVGWSDKAFFAFGANIINDNPAADDTTPTTITCYAFQNETTINTDWIRYFAPNVAYRVFGRYSSGEGENDPQQLYGYDGLTENVVTAQPATSIGGTPVSLDRFGRLLGRVHQMNSISGRPVDLRSTKVMLLKGDDVVGSTTTDNFGVFQFSGLREGGYGLLAVGVDGVGLVGIEVLGESSTVLDEEGAAEDGEGLPFDFTMISAETVGWLNHYASDVAYRRALLKPRLQNPNELQVVNDPVCPTCLGIMGRNGCPKCGKGRDDAYCQSPCITYEDWVRRGCACKDRGPALRRIGDRVRESAERFDNRFEEAFYGSDGDYGDAIEGGTASPTALMQGVPSLVPATLPPVVPAPLPPVVQPDGLFSPISFGSGT